MVRVYLYLILSSSTKEPIMPLIGADGRPDIVTTNIILNRGPHYQKPSALTHFFKKPVQQKKSHNIRYECWVDAQLSQDCYYEEQKRLKDTSWERVGDPHDYPPTKLRAVVYKNVALKQVVIAIRGTQPNFPNILADVLLFLDKMGIKGKTLKQIKSILGLKIMDLPSAYIKSLNQLLGKVKNAFPKDYSIHFTGHSLGAALALNLNLEHNYRGTVFECPGLAVQKPFPKERWAKQQIINCFPNFINRVDKSPCPKAFIYHPQSTINKINQLKKQQANCFDQLLRGRDLKNAAVKFAKATVALIGAQHNMANILGSLHAIYKIVPNKVRKPTAAAIKVNRPPQKHVGNYSAVPVMITTHPCKPRMI